MQQWQNFMMKMLSLKCLLPYQFGQFHLKLMVIKLNVMINIAQKCLPPLRPAPSETNMIKIDIMMNIAHKWFTTTAASFIQD